MTECKSESRNQAFTVIELLVVIGIIAILSSIAAAAYTGVRRKAYSAKEVTAGRSLVAALNAQAADNNGLMLYGYDGATDSVRVGGEGFPEGTVSGSEAHRYLWRLAPYFDYNFDATTVLSPELQQILKERDVYLLSLLPSLGINAYGVGGYVESGSGPNEGAVRNVMQAHAPSKLIAFASARVKHESFGGIAPGFHLVLPPKSPGGSWSSSYDEENPSSWGNVDLRHGNKAVVAFLDGSAALLGEGELEDMRLWNNDAAKKDDPNYRPSSGRDRRGRR